MSSTSAPGHTTTNTTAETVNTHQGHRLTHVGAIAVNSPTQKQGSTMDVWYCQNDHQLFTDIKS